MTVDSNGNIWFTETTANIPNSNPTGAIGEFDPSTGAFTQSYLTSASTDPVGIAWDPTEAQFWITEPSANQIVSFNPATSGSAVAPIKITDPVGVLVDPATGYLWIAEGSADKIVNYDPINEQILYTFSTSGSPGQLTWGSDGNIWFTESGAVGVLQPPTGPGTGSILAQIAVSGTANDLALGPSSGPYAGTIWFTLTGSKQVGEIDIASQSLVGYSTAPDTNANAIALGPDGNMWFTSGQGKPAWIGAVVLNPNDLGAQVVVTTQPPNTEETVFGGFVYGFGLIVSVENSAGQVDPFVQQGTITIALDANPGGGALGPQSSSLSVTVNDGLAIFDGLTIDAPGQGYTIQATYSDGLNQPVTNPFTVTGPATKLVVTSEPPTSVAAGAAFGLTVVAEDANGFVVPTFDDPIDLTILTNPPGDGVLNGTDPLGALYGTSAFNDLSIDQVGNGYTLQVTDPAVGASVTSTTTAAFNVTPGPAAQLLFSASGEPPATATAGQNLASPTAIVVDAEDKYGNIDPTYSGQVTIVLANGATGTLAGTLTVNASKGVATFSSIAIDTAGTFELEAKSGTLSPATSTSIAISPAAPAKIVWTTQPPSAATAGIPFAAAVQIEDQYGNLETGDNSNVSMALDLGGNPDSTDLGGTTSVAASGGSASFSNLIINAGGNPFTLVASSGGVSSPASAAIAVTEPQLVVTAQPTGAVTAGLGFAITVTAETSSGATDMYFAGTVVLSIASGPSGAAISGTTSVTASSGVASFTSIVLGTPGNYVLQAASGKLTTGDTGTIDVVGAQLVVTTQPPGSVAAGSGFGLTVTAETTSGSPDPAFTGAVNLSIATGPSGASLGGQPWSTPSVASPHSATSSSIRPAVMSCRPQPLGRPR